MWQYKSDYVAVQECLCGSTRVFLIQVSGYHHNSIFYSSHVYHSICMKASGHILSSETENSTSGFRMFPQSLRKSARTTSYESLRLLYMNFLNHNKK